MSSYFAGLVDFVGAHPQVSFLAVFLLALSEAVPVIGTVVPGSSLIIAISALATAANITPCGLLIAAAAGAIAGDGFSFYPHFPRTHAIIRSSFCPEEGRPHSL